MSKLARAIGLLAITSCLLLACGDDDGGEPAAERDAADVGTTTMSAPHRGGTVTWINATGPRGLRPTEISGNPGIDGPYGLALYDALILERWDGELEYRIAESLRSDDRITWTLTLRDGIEFSDGTPYDAEAVKYNWELIADPANASQNRSAMQMVKSLTVVDPRTLRIELVQPIGQWPRFVAEKLSFVASPTALRDPTVDFASKPVGAGPFLLERWVRGSTADFVRNDAYWDAPRPYVDGLSFRLIGDCVQGSNTLRTLENGFFSSHTCASVARDAESAGIPVDKIEPAVGGLTLAFQMGRPPFDDIRARRAIALALDLQQHAQTVELGVVTAPEFLVRPGTRWHDPAIRQVRHDASTAQRLLDELAAEKGGPLEFAFSGTPDAAVASTVELFISQLSRFNNVRARPDLLVASEYGAKLLAGDYELAVLSAYGPDPVPQFVEYFSSGSARNSMKYSNPEVDKALMTLQSSDDEDERVAAFAVVQRHLANDIPMLWYTKRTIFVARHESLRGFEAVTTGYRWDTIHVEG